MPIVIIPRTIHHVWLGGDMPDREQWLRSTVLSLHSNEWEFHLWESDDVLAGLPNTWREPMAARWKAIPSVCPIPHRQMAYRADILRLAIIWSVGGFYLDCDMFGVRPLDDMLDPPDGIVLMEFRKGHVGEGVVAAPPASEKIAMAIENYLRHPECRYSGLYLGPLARHNGWHVYPPEWFCPHPRMPNGPRHDLYAATENTHTIHCWRDHVYDPQKLMATRPVMEAAA